MLCGSPTLKITASRKARRRWQAAQVSVVHPVPPYGGEDAEHLVGVEESKKSKHHFVVRLCEDDDPLFALLHRSQHSPIAKLDSRQKLAWLRSQVIGSNQEISTAFGTRQLVYADHTASGRSLLFVENFIRQHVLPFYGNTHTDDSYVGSRTSRLMRGAEEYIKERLGGSKEDALLMCGWGCTAAIKRLQEVMGIAVPSILRRQVLDMMFGSQVASQANERWLVFVGPYEHHSNLLSWRQSLAEVREIPANEDGMVDMKRLEAELQAAQVAGRRRKLGAFSACSNVTGIFTDTRAIARLLHKYGALACFDFAAGASHMQVEMRSSEPDGYDAVVMSPHKLFGGPGSPGILLMKKSLYKLGKNPPSTCGGGTVAYVNGFTEEDTLYHEKIEEREEGGTPPILGKVRCALAFWVKDSIGMAFITQREDFYLDTAMTRLSTIPNIRILGPYPPSNGMAPIFSFLITTTTTNTTTEQGADRRIACSAGKPLHGRFVAKLLNDLFGIQSRGGCACASPYGHVLLGISKEHSLAIRNAIQKGYEGLKPGWTRLSLCYSMTQEEVDYILSALGFLASYGHRFLGLYDFDWRSGNWTLLEEKANGLIMPKEKGDRMDNQLATLVPLECKRAPSQRECFHHHLQHARALSHLLPCHSIPRPMPPNLDPSLLFFQI